MADVNYQEMQAPLMAAGDVRVVADTNCAVAAAAPPGGGGAMGQPQPQPPSGGVAPVAAAPYVPGPATHAVPMAHGLRQACDEQLQQLWGTAIANSPSGPASSHAAALGLDKELCEPVLLSRITVETLDDVPRVLRDEPFNTRLFLTKDRLYVAAEFDALDRTVALLSPDANPSHWDITVHAAHRFAYWSVPLSSIFNVTYDTTQNRTTGASVDLKVKFWPAFVVGVLAFICVVVAGIAGWQYEQASSTGSSYTYGAQPTKSPFASVTLAIILGVVALLLFVVAVYFAKTCKSPYATALPAAATRDRKLVITAVEPVYLRPCRIILALATPTDAYGERGFECNQTDRVLAFIGSMQAICPRMQAGDVVSLGDFHSVIQATGPRRV